MEWYVERRFDANETLMSYDKPKLIAIINEFMLLLNKRTTRVTAKELLEFNVIKRLRP